MKTKIYQGLIREISNVDPDQTGHQKQRVVIEEEYRQLSEIEFNGSKMLQALQGYKINDNVIIAAYNKGSRSKKCGKFYNNIIANTITKQ